MPTLNNLPGDVWDKGEDVIYCEAQFSPEDILYEGSDDEDYNTPEARRLAYEAAGQRYLRGQAPYLLTTTLRGPFEKSSGWTNPWRSKYRTSVKPSASYDLKAERKRPRTTTVCQTQLTTTQDSLTSHLPSPESLKQATPTAPHPYLEEDELSAVESWVQSVPPSFSARPSQSAGSNSSTKRRASSEWLKTVPLKRRKIDAYTKPMDSPTHRRRRLSTKQDAIDPNALISFSSAPGRLDARPIRHSQSRNKLDQSEDEDELTVAFRSFNSAPVKLISPPKRISPRRTIHKARGAGHTESDDELSQHRAAAATLSSPVSQKGARARLSREHRSLSKRALGAATAGSSSQRREISIPEKTTKPEASISEIPMIRQDKVNIDTETFESQQDQSFCFKKRPKIPLEGGLAQPEQTRQNDVPQELSKPDCPPGNAGDNDALVYGLDETMDVSGDDSSDLSSVDSCDMIAPTFEPETQDYDILGVGAERDDPPEDYAVATYELIENETNISHPALEAPEDPPVSIDNVPFPCHEPAIDDARLDHETITQQSECDAVEQQLANESATSHDLIMEDEVVTDYQDDVGQNATCQNVDQRDNISIDAPAAVVDDTVPEEVSVAPFTPVAAKAMELEDDVSTVIAGGGLGTVSQQSPWVETQRLPLETTATLPDITESPMSSTPSKPNDAMPSSSDQSPWAAGTDPVTPGQNPLATGVIDDVEVERSVPKADDFVFRTPAIPPPSTPEPLFAVKSFASFMSPSPRRRLRDNPYSGSSARVSGRLSILSSGIKSTDSSRASRRVSWAPLPHEGGQQPAPESPIAADEPGSHDATRQASPPPAKPIAELPTSEDARFRNHFSAVASRAKVLKRRSSHATTLSPGPFALAERFLDMDKTHQGGKGENGDKENGDDKPRDVTAADDLREPSEERDLLDEVFNEMNDFLGAFDVDAELDEARKAGSAGRTTGIQSPW